MVIFYIEQPSIPNGSEVHRIEQEDEGRGFGHGIAYSEL